MGKKSAAVSSDDFSRFNDAVKRILSVPKDEVLALEGEERLKRDRERQRKSDNAAPDQDQPQK